MTEATSIDGGRIAARQLKAAGIDTVFGVVAGPMIQVFAGAQAEGLSVVGCRHEENAAFMASAWGWLRRKPGVVIVGSGPGMTNAVTPLHVATESGMPLVVRIAFKPPSSIAKPQATVSVNTLKETSLAVTGRHDPCVLPRAVPVVESMVALVLADHGLRGGLIPAVLKRSATPD